VKARGAVFIGPPYRSLWSAWHWEFLRFILLVFLSQSCLSSLAIKELMMMMIIIIIMIAMVMMPKPTQNLYHLYMHIAVL